MPKGEHAIKGRRFCFKGQHHRTHHVHVFQVGSLHIKRHVAFRDYLIAHHAAREYGNLKLECIAAGHNDIEKYCAARKDFITAHEKHALHWLYKATK
jgi:GrpB-like predicted nucleotidyltransferase (UPF0157 family)